MISLYKPLKRQVILGLTQGLAFHKVSWGLGFRASWLWGLSFHRILGFGTARKTKILNCAEAPHTITQSNEPKCMLLWGVLMRPGV